MSCSLKYTFKCFAQISIHDRDCKFRIGIHVDYILIAARTGLNVMARVVANGGIVQAAVFDRRCV